MYTVGKHMSAWPYTGGFRSQRVEWKWFNTEVNICKINMTQKRRWCEAVFERISQAGRKISETRIEMYNEKDKGNRSEVTLWTKSRFSGHGRKKIIISKIRLSAFESS